VGDLTLYNEHILHNMNSALLVVDPDGSVTTANRGAERILGEPEEELRGRSVWDWFPGSSEPLWLHRALRQGARLRGVEARLVRRDGSAVPIGVSVGPLLDRDGRRLGAVAIFQDLTEMNDLRRALLQKEKLASIGQLAAGVAHEINNPMGFIDANLMQMGEYLEDLRRLWGEIRALRNAVRAGDWATAASAGAGLDELCGELDAEFVLGDLAKAVVESREGSARIRRIVQDLRVFSRQDPPERVPADLNQCLDSTANIAWSMMKNVVVLHKDYAELPPLPCDAQQLKQVFLNLLVNAYQAIVERGAGGEEPRGEIRLETEHRDGRIFVRVVDNGAGIAPAHLERIFDPFFTTKEVGVGTGLGLSTSFNIVRAHGGKIRVESEPGRGARFELELPLAPEEALAGAGSG
jgi:two-component system NtrC family sensor kinase